LSDSNSTSTNSTTMERFQPNSIEVSPEEQKVRAEHQKLADEWTQRALARLNKIGEQKAAEKAARSPSHTLEMSLGADPELAAKQELPTNTLPLM
jgi:hypothetical protein